MRFSVTYIDPSSGKETTTTATGESRTEVEDEFIFKGLKPVRVDWLSDDRPLENLEMQDTPTAPLAYSAPKPKQDKSLLGCLAFCGMLFAIGDFFTISILGILGDFFLAFVSGLMLIVATIRSMLR